MNRVLIDDTIAAISTALGEGAIGIIRLSGPKSFEIASKIFSSPQGKQIETANRTLLYGYIINPENNQRVDEVLLSVMRGPKTFTAEDVVEINCHGGPVPIKNVLELLLKNGARLAEAGEFTKRAFLNGRIDLAQAEAVIDVIRSKTQDGLQVAMTQLEGALSQKTRALRNKLLELLAFIEAGIDFPEHDIEELSIRQISERTNDIISEVKFLIENADAGKIYREGLNTVIIGKPNVGKSSLLNALLREKRAIVTDIPGTTRDVIEEFLNIKGIPLKLVDTAGIRETADLVEKIGVEKSLERFKEADLIILVLDAFTGVTQEDIEIIEMIKGRKGIAVLNKIDLTESYQDFISESIKPWPLIKISVREEKGLDKLEDAIIDLVREGSVSGKDDLFVSNVRHKNALEIALRHLEGVKETIEMDMPTDCMSIDLKASWEALGEISGDTIGEDIIDQIFAQFCLGK